MIDINNKCKIIIIDPTNFNFRKIYFIFNGKKEGECKQYYGNGQLWVISNYKNDKLEGEYKTYCYDGQLYKSCNCKDGRLDRKLLD